MHSATIKRLSHCSICALTLNLLTTTIVAPPSNASKWQMGFNSAFKGLKVKVQGKGKVHPRTGNEGPEEE